ncbi:hypothetical protein GR212_26885 [Rhizobium lusitanum]|uniref:4-alpha-glucanotransferase n=1 Tax=Rhizobium lusitanum TaxID=293958 RepID=A0A6L9UH05_9HYPH|nr:hypothetical protein [Rhizobium lusitanum]
MVGMFGLAHSFGAHFVGPTPLQAPFLADPDRRSSYDPSNQQILNPLHIAVDKVTGFKSTPEPEKLLGKLRQTDRDYVRAAETKLKELREASRSAENQSAKERRDFEALVRKRA